MSSSAPAQPAASRFLIAPKMAGWKRILWIVASLVFGFNLQVTVSLFWGWPFVLLAGLFAATKSISNEPAIKKSKGSWENVTENEFGLAETTLKVSRQFTKRVNSFSLKTAKGCFGCLLSLAGICIVALLIAAIVDVGINYEQDVFKPVLAGGPVAVLFAIDALTLFAPLFLAGGVKTWEPPNLAMKMEQLRAVRKAYQSRADLEFVPSLFLVKTEKGSVPTDCRLTAKVKGAPESFLGIQIQTSLNSVQSTTYPYTYCVLVAKPELGLAGKVKGLIQQPPAGGFKSRWGADSNTIKESRFARYREALVEVKKEGDVEIAVIRQNTSGTGYKTSPGQAATIFATALDLSERALGETA